MYQVLIVDDEAIIRKGLHQIIPWARLGFQVVDAVPSAEKALAVLEEKPVDVLLTDIQMPGQSGLDLAAEVKQQNPNTKIVVISGYDRFDYAVEALKIRVDDYILKPLDPDAIQKTFQQLHRQLEEESAQKNRQKQHLHTENEYGILRLLGNELLDEQRVRAQMGNADYIRQVLVWLPPLPADLWAAVGCELNRLAGDYFCISTQVMYALFLPSAQCGPLLDKLNTLFAQYPAVEHKIAVSAEFHHPADGDQFLRMQNGLLAPIDEFLEADGIDMEADYGPYALWAKSGESYYGLPLRVNLEGMFFNKTMFDEAGISYPDENWTMEEYIEIARQLTSGEGPDKVYGTYTHVWSGVWNNIGAEAESYYTADGMCNFDNPAFRKILEMRKMLDDEGIQQSFSQISAVNAMPNSAFLGGQCAMVPAGSWLIRDMKDQENYPHDFEIGWNYQPRYDETIGENSLNISVSILGIPASSKNKEAAWKFLRFYIEENAMAIAASGNIPCYVPGYSDDLMNTYIEGSGLAMEYAEKLFTDNITASSSKVGAPPDAYDSAPQYDQIMDEETQLYFNGEQDIDTTMQNVVDQVDAIIEAEK